MEVVVRGPGSFEDEIICVVVLLKGRVTVHVHLW